MLLGTSAELVRAQPWQASAVLQGRINLSAVYTPFGLDMRHALASQIPTRLRIIKLTVTR